MADYDPINLAAAKNTEPLSYSPETDEPTPAETTYVEKALENLLATSRTAKGTVDTSASATKAGVMAIGSGEQAANVSRENFEGTIRRLYHERDWKFESAEELRAFIEGVVLAINDGITKEGTIYRSGEDAHNKYGYTRIADIEQAMQEFCTELHTKLADPATDPIETAGWVEYHIDVTDHFFADGCGKVSKAVAAYVLMRNDLPLPSYRSREEHYANAPQHIRGDDADQTRQEYDKWMDYYRSLFDEVAQ